jgi:hypothetical protein
MIVFALALVFLVVGLFGYGFYEYSVLGNVDFLDTLAKWQNLLAALSVVTGGMFAFASAFYKIKSDERVARVNNAKDVVNNISQVMLHSWNLHLRCVEFAMVMLDYRKEDLESRLKAIEEEYDRFKSYFLDSAYAGPYKSINFVINAEFTLLTIRSRLTTIAPSGGIGALLPLGDIQPNTKSAKKLNDIIGCLQQIDKAALDAMLDCSPAIVHWVGKRMWPWERRSERRRIREILLEDERRFNEIRDRLSGRNSPSGTLHSGS